MILFSPFFILFFMMPLIILILLYASSLAQYIYKRRSRILEAINNQDYMEGYGRLVCAWWAGHGSVWHSQFIYYDYIYCYIYIKGYRRRLPQSQKNSGNQEKSGKKKLYVIFVCAWWAGHGSVWHSQFVYYNLYIIIIF